MPFKKGQSGNPHGRPKKGKTLTDALKKKMSAEWLADQLYVLCKKRDLGAIKYVYDRIEGRPKETIEQTVTEVPKVVWYEDDTDTEDSTTTKK